MRLYLDEMFHRRIAVRLRQRGIDAVSALELGHVSMPDEMHLLFAAGQGRCVVTQNYSDFVRHTSEFASQGLLHAGVLMVPTSQSTRDFGPLIRALSQFAEAHLDDLPPYSILWLPPGTGD